MFNKPSNKQFAAIFDGIAPRYNKILNRYSAYRRVEFITQYAQGRCLEVGAGNGAVAGALSKNHEVEAVDISPAMVKVIKKQGIKACVADAEKLSFKNADFDTVVAAEVIYYLDNPDKFIKEANRVLKPKGRLLLTSAAKITQIYDRIRSWLRRLGFTSMYFDDKNRTFMSETQLEKLLTENGFRIQRLEKAVILPWAFFDPLNRLLEKTPLKCFCGFNYIYAQK